jgi:hypothetical protein
MIEYEKMAMMAIGFFSGIYIFKRFNQSKGDFKKPFTLSEVENIVQTKEFYQGKEESHNKTDNYTLDNKKDSKYGFISNSPPKQYSSLYFPEKNISLPDANNSNVNNSEYAMFSNKENSPSSPYSCLK